MPDGTRFFKWNKVLDVDLAGYIVKHGSGGWASMKPLYDGVITTNSFESSFAVLPNTLWWSCAYSDHTPSEF
jgi:hypothetical protein